MGCNRIMWLSGRVRFNRVQVHGTTYSNIHIKVLRLFLRVLMRIERVQGNPAKRFMARYGSTLRKKIAEIEREQRALHICPSCGVPGVRRVSAGIWVCRKCGYKFAGGAWTPFPKK